MAVVCEGQLLLLTQPTDGPVTEPSVLGSVPITEVLIDDNVKPPSFLHAADICYAGHTKLDVVI